HGCWNQLRQTIGLGDTVGDLRLRGFARACRVGFHRALGSICAVGSCRGHDRGQNDETNVETDQTAVRQALLPHATELLAALTQSRLNKGLTITGQEFGPLQAGYFACARKVIRLALWPMFERARSAAKPAA